MKFLTSLMSFALTSIAMTSAQGTIDDSTPPFDLNGSNFTYPHPVKLYKFTSQLQPLEMAFMDVAPTVNANNKTAVLFHGRNFCAATWNGTISALTSKGYRVIAVDQVGFCKSSKPERYQYSLHQFALNTNNLLKTLGLNKTTVIGHSFGGMLAARYGLMYPDQVEKLVSVNAIGLEDYKAVGVPYLPIDNSYITESNANFNSIRAYENSTYYIGDWKPEYDIWVTMLVNIYKGSKASIYHLIQAQIIDVVLTQPVAWEFGLLKTKTLLMIGEKDTTAIGKNWSPPEVAAKLGKFDLLGPKVVKQIKKGELKRFPEMGHSPHISHPEEFHKALLKWLAK